MQNLTFKSLFAAMFITASLSPVAASATQIAADAGQFAVQAQLVQNACVPEFAERTKGSQELTVQVVLRGCAFAPHAISVESSTAEKGAIAIGQPVTAKITASESSYYINARFLSSSLTHIEPLGATLQVTYF